MCWVSPADENPHGVLVCSSKSVPLDCPAVRVHVDVLVPESVALAVRLQPAFPFHCPFHLTEHVVALWCQCRAVPGAPAAHYVFFLCACWVLQPFLASMLGSRPS